MNLKDIHAFDACFHIQVKRLENGKLEVIISSNGKDKKHIIKDGQSMKVKL
jgi:hypothetical protein